MSQLTVGQRVDVYEVVANIPSSDGGVLHSFKIGCHLAATDRTGNIFFTNYPIVPFFKAAHLDSKEVKKCGYYLKVKSLKGGNNEQ